MRYVTDNKICFFISNENMQKIYMSKSIEILIDITPNQIISIRKIPFHKRSVYVAHLHAYYIEYVCYDKMNHAEVNWIF